MVKREIGRSGPKRPARNMMTADLKLPIIATETGENADSNIQQPVQKASAPRPILCHAEEIFEPIQVNGSM